MTKRAMPRPAQDRLNKLLRKNPHLSLGEVATVMKVTVQRVRVLARETGWAAETHTYWTQDR